MTKEIDDAIHRAALDAGLFVEKDDGSDLTISPDARYVTVMRFARALLVAQPIDAEAVAVTRGWNELLNVVLKLREFGEYRDEEGESTDDLAALYHWIAEQRSTPEGIRAIERKTLERAAKVCDEKAFSQGTLGRMIAAQDCAEAIRAMIDKEAK